jgi:BirA family transcriptional regulator, biotin operon repressor / biotin---[acetyl-CoA-carboxylase] ligase
MASYLRGVVTDLSRDEIVRSVHGRFGRSVRVFEELDSTNTEAWRWIDDGAEEGSLVIADQMTAGRGRWGRKWLTAPGKQLLVSLVLRRAPSLARAGLLTTAAGVACAEAIENVARLPATIKWPNDVNVEGRKVAGILVETRTSGDRADAVVVGIGINSSFRAGELPAEISQTASSIAIECERRGQAIPSRLEVLVELLARLESAHSDVSDRPDDLLARASDRSEVLGRDVTIRFSDGRVIRGRAVRLLSSGELEISSGGSTTSIDGGEIERLRISEK